MYSCVLTAVFAIPLYYSFLHTIFVYPVFIIILFFAARRGIWMMWHGKLAMAKILAVTPLKDDLKKAKINFQFSVSGGKIIHSSQIIGYRKSEIPSGEYPIIYDPNDPNDFNLNLNKSETLQTKYTAMQERKLQEAFRHKA